MRLLRTYNFGVPKLDRWKMPENDIYLLFCRQDPVVDPFD